MYLRGGQTLISGSSVSLCGEIAEAKASVGIAPREMREQRDDESATRRNNHYHPWLEEGIARTLDKRPRIALVVNGDEGIVVENRVKNQIYKQMREKFPIEKFAVMKGSDVNTYLLQKSEDEVYDIQKSRAIKTDDGKVLHTTTTNDIDDMPVDMKTPRGLSDMRLGEYVQAGRTYGYDYVFVITVSLGKLRTYNHYWILFSTHSSKQNVWVRARLVDAKKGNYLYRNDIATTGTAHNNMLNGRVYERSIKEAVQEIMDDIMIND